jgi:hypothetical protein
MMSPFLLPMRARMGHNRTGRIIKLLTAQEVLDEEFVQKM